MSDDNNTPVVETPAPTQVPQPVTKPPLAPEGKSYSEDYVHSLREENKSYRLSLKAKESTLKDIIGLKDNDEINDDKIAKWKADKEKEFNTILTKANEKLILAEIKSLEGYNSKLVERLLDKSKVEIAEDGTVTGLKEAVEELVTEFPEIKVEASGTGANPPQPGDKTVADEYNEIKALIAKNPGNSNLMQKLFLIKEKMKQ